ncbi:MAG: type II toxin-antitoxin system PemK/MazF family toxin [Gloeomargarita sp. SKYG98]|nr:type II toxin-antitoxin system PemK/MazF family toxin [Gloeomargarita sp. SKYG98]
MEHQLQAFYQGPSGQEETDWAEMTEATAIAAWDKEASWHYAKTVLVVPFSSDIDASHGNPCRILFPAGEGGLERPSVAMGDLITTVHKSLLEQGPYGRVWLGMLRQVQQAIQLSISYWCSALLKSS